MRRDLELLRKMVLAIEDAPGGWVPQRLPVEGYAEDVLMYHGYLLVDAGLARGWELPGTRTGAPGYIVSHLTWAGHEFAEAARNETSWNKAMGLVREKGGAITVSVLTMLLTSYMRHAFGLP